MLFKQKASLYCLCAALLMSKGIHSSAPNTITSAIGSPNFNAPTSIAITPDGSTAYVVNSGTTNHDHAISIIDVSTNTVTGYVQDPNNLLDHPTYISIIPNGSIAYVINGTYPSSSDSLCYIDLNPSDTTYNTVIGTVPQTYPFTNLTAVGYTLDSSTAYVADAASQYITLVATPADPYNQIHTRIYGANMAVSPDGSTLYTTDGVSSLVINSTGSYHVLATLSIPGAGAIAFGDNTDKAYIACSTGVAIINVPTNALASPSSVSGASTPPSYIAFTPDGSTAYLVYAEYNMISVVDVATDTVIDTLTNDTATPLNAPYAVAITPGGSKGYITDQGATAPGTVSIMTYVNPYGYDYPYIYPIPPDMPTPLPPSKINGCKTQNVFFTQTDFINNITWTAPTVGTIPAAYSIYRDPYLTDLVATVPASGALQYYDHNRNPNVTYSYYIVSVDAFGNMSEPNSVMVVNLC